MVIRYRTKPERADENARLIRRVFEELQAKSPRGLGYLALDLGAGNFLHFVMEENELNPGAITRLEAFQHFRAGIAERCLEPPKSSEVTIIGEYGMLAPSQAVTA
jgi:hypothetical protein